MRVIIPVMSVCVCVLQCFLGSTPAGCIDVNES